MQREPQGERGPGPGQTTGRHQRGHQHQRAPSRAQQLHGDARLADAVQVGQVEAQMPEKTVHRIRLDAVGATHHQARQPGEGRQRCRAGRQDVQERAQRRASDGAHRGCAQHAAHQGPLPKQPAPPRPERLAGMVRIIVPMGAHVGRPRQDQPSHGGRQRGVDHGARLDRSTSSLPEGQRGPQEQPQVDQRRVAVNHDSSGRFPVSRTAYVRMRDPQKEPIGQPSDV